MFRLSCLLGALMLIVFCLLIMAMKAFSAAQTSNLAAIEGFRNCAAACWYGIPLSALVENDFQKMINAMTLDGYRYQLKQDDLHITHFLFSADGHCDVDIWFNLRHDAIFLTIFNCPPLVLGDILTLMGDPIWIQADGSTLFYTIGRSEQSTFVTLNTGDWFTWLTPVDEIFMTTGAIGGTEAFEWQGVMPRSYYCQMEPIC